MHRAAAFADVEAIQMLIRAGARMEVRDSNNDTPLSWASWHLRSGSVLKLLCHGDHQICDVGVDTIWLIKVKAGVGWRRDYEGSHISDDQREFILAHNHFRE